MIKKKFGWISLLSMILNIIAFCLFVMILGGGFYQSAIWYIWIILCIPTPFVPLYAKYYRVKNYQSGKTFEIIALIMSLFNFANVCVYGLNISSGDIFSWIVVIVCAIVYSKAIKELSKADSNVNNQIDYSEEMSDNKIIEEDKISEKKSSINESTYKPQKAFSFENEIEFIIYSKLYGDNTEIVWTSATQYLEKYQQGYNYFESHNFEKAIETYLECLQLNPIGILARFELCECYLHTSNFQVAKKSLIEMTNYLYKATDIAKFYRRYGFCETESMQYECAFACYAYSLRYEKHPSVSQELAYINSKWSGNIDPFLLENVLKSYNVPILKPI